MLQNRIHKKKKKKKERKEMKIAQETTGATLNAPIIHYTLYIIHYRCPEWRRKRIRTWQNIWLDNSWKLPQHRKENNQPSSGSTESPRQDKHKEHTETYNNETDKN